MAFGIKFAVPFLFVFITQFWVIINFYALLVIVSQELAEYIRLIILALSLPRVRLPHWDAALAVAGGFSLFSWSSPAGKPVDYGDKYDGIHALSARFRGAAFGKLVDDSRSAAHCRNNPYRCTPTSPFLRLYPLKVRFGAPVLRFRVVVLRSTFDGVVSVFQQPGQVILTLFSFIQSPLLALSGVADGISIFNDVFAFRKIFQRKFVSGRNILVQGDSPSVHREFSTGRSAVIATATLSAGLIFRYFASICYLHLAFTMYDWGELCFLVCDSCFLAGMAFFIVNGPNPIYLLEIYILLRQQVQSA